MVGRIIHPLPIFAFLCFVVSIPSSAFCQAELQEQGGESSFSGVDRRRLEVALRSGTDLCRDGDYARGLSLLQQVISNSEDFFLEPDAVRQGQEEPEENGAQAKAPDGAESAKPDAESKAKDGDAQPKTLKSAALEVIAELPPEGRKAYELEYGTIAQRMLESAVASNSVSNLQTVARSYFHTQAGYKATYHLAGYFFDRSEPISAIILLERLRAVPQAARQWEPALSLKIALGWLRAGKIERCKETLASIAAGDLSAVSLGGERINVTAMRLTIEDLLAVASQVPPDDGSFVQSSWPVFGGNAPRTGVSEKVAPLWSIAWNANPLRDLDLGDAEDAADFRGTLVRLRERYEAGSGTFLTLPAIHPIVVGDNVITRTFKNLKAFDINSGELRWESALVDPIYDTLKTNPGVGQVQGGYRETPFDVFVKQRAWRDLTAGTISSDDRFVYAVEDSGLLGGAAFRNFRGRGVPNLLLPRDNNKLTAFEAETGRFIWEIGGPRDEYALDFAGLYFLGPPLPLNGHLYCLVEESGEIRLLALRPVEDRPGHWTVKLDWSQGIADADPLPANISRRRLAGLSPSYADGIMVCPTGSGKVVAVDLSRRMLLWEFGYRPILEALSRQQLAQMMAMGRNLYSFDTSDDEGRWLSSCILISDGSVVFTPPDSQELFCLGLTDGELAWKQPRGQGLYAATIYDDRVIVVDRAHVRAVRLVDGQSAWGHDVPIGMSGGRGLRTAAHYHVPLESGDLVTIHLHDGLVTASSTGEAGQVPGNLVAAGGRLLSFTPAKLIGFASLEELTTRIAGNLKNNKEDTSAWALAGELGLHYGEAEAVDQLRQAVKLDEHSKARTILARHLIEELRIDFAAHRQSATEIESLLDRPQDRSDFLRLYADGLREAGEHEAAFAAYLKMAGPNTSEPSLDQLSGEHFVRSDRWVGAKIAELFAAADGTQKADFEKRLARQFEISSDLENVEPLRKYLNFFDQLPTAEQARRELVDQLDPTKKGLERSLQLRVLQQSPESSTRAFATAELASQLISEGHADEALPELQRLETEFAGVECRDGATGKQLAEKWKTDDAVVAALSNDSLWPTGDIVTDYRNRSGTIDRFYPFEFRGPRSPYFEGWILGLDQRRQFLVAQDEHGQEKWRIAADDDTSPPPNIYGNYALVAGHLMVVVLGDRLLVLDASSPDSKPRVLWRTLLYDDPTGRVVGRGVQVRQRVLNNGQREYAVLDPFGRPMGMVGVVENRLIVFQVGTQLRAADPLTGKLLWQRNNIARGSQIFGDGETVFVLPPGREDAMVFRARDGQSSGTRTLSAAQQNSLLTDGTRLLSWDEVNDERVLSFYDEMTKQDVWSKRFSENAVVTLVEDEDVAILEPDGEFLILRIRDGEPLVQAKLTAMTELSEIHVLRSRTHYTLLTNTTNIARGMRVVGIGFNSVTAHGPAYGFDRRSGEKVWSTNIEYQTIEPIQPGDLPVLVFVSRRFQLPGVGVPARSNEYSILVIDDRTGKKIFEKTGPLALSTFGVTTDVEKKTIDVEFYRSALTVKFPTPNDVEKKQEKTDEKPADKPTDEDGPKPPSEKKPDE